LCRQQDRMVAAGRVHEPAYPVKYHPMTGSPLHYNGGSCRTVSLP
jgi:hypothetical protein